MIDPLKKNIYNQMQRFAAVTNTFLLQGNLARAKRCMLVAEHLFNKGNKQVKNAVSNVYLFSVSSFMEVHDSQLRGLLPSHLETEYLQQVNAKGI